MPDGAVTLCIDNPVVKLPCSLVKLLTLDLVVTCLKKRSIQFQIYFERNYINIAVHIGVKKGNP